MASWPKRYARRLLFPVGVFHYNGVSPHQRVAAAGVVFSFATRTYSITIFSARATDIRGSGKSWVLEVRMYVLLLMVFAWFPI